MRKEEWRWLLDDLSFEGNFFMGDCPFVSLFGVEAIGGGCAQTVKSIACICLS